MLDCEDFGELLCPGMENLCFFDAIGEKSSFDKETHALRASSKPTSSVKGSVEGLGMRETRLMLYNSGIIENPL